MNVKPLFWQTHCWWQLNSNEMNAKERAIELVNDFKDFVNPFVGSGMLSIWIDDVAILAQSKQCATKAVKQIQKDCIKDISNNYYWVSVEKEIANVSVKDLQFKVS